MLDQYRRNTAGIPWECCRDNEVILQKYLMNTAEILQ